MKHVFAFLFFVAAGYLATPLLSQSVGAEKFFAQANKFLDQGDFANAIDYYSEAIRMHPAHVNAHFNRGIAYHSQGKMNKAIYDFSFVLELRSDDAEARQYRGSAHFELGSYDEALADFSNAIDGMTSSLLYINRGNTLLKMERYREALADFESALQLRPRESVALSGKAEVLCVLGRKEEALQLFDQAISIDPEDALAYNNRANLKAQLKRFDAAIADYDRAILLFPQAEMFANRALCLMELDRWEQAAVDGVQAARMNRNSAKNHFIAGKALIRADEAEMALQYLNIAIGLEEGDADYYNERGKAYADVEELYEAIGDFNKALKLEPKHPEASKNLHTTYQKMDSENEGMLERSPYKSGSTGKQFKSRKTAPAELDLDQMSYPMSWPSRRSKEQETFGVDLIQFDD